MNYSFSTDNLEEYKLHLAAPRLANIIRDLEEWLDEESEEQERNDSPYFKGIARVKEELRELKTQHLSESPNNGA